MKNYSGKEILITGGLGFIGSNLARSLVAQGANVTLVDSLIPQYGGNPFNIEDIRDKVSVNFCDVRDTLCNDIPHSGERLFIQFGRTDKSLRFDD